MALEISSGRSTPYYYKADGVMEAYIRVGNESVIAPNYIVNELILKGTNQSFDTLTTDAAKKDYSFTLLETTYLQRTGLRFEPSDYISFGLADKEYEGNLIYLLKSGSEDSAPSAVSERILALCTKPKSKKDPINRKRRHSP